MYYKESEKNLIKITQNIEKFRGKNDKQIINAIRENLNNPYLLKYLFFVRDIEKGLGERNFFKVSIRYLAKENKIPEDFNLIKSIVYFGRIDDLFILFGTKYEKDVLHYIARQLEEDLFKIREYNGKRVSLLGKWLPSENASSKKTKKYAYKIMNFLRLEPREYRKILSILRKNIDIVERKMCANEWNKINVFNVPKYIAANRYEKAFKKHNVCVPTKQGKNKKNKGNVLRCLQTQRYSKIPLVF